ncbi:MAG: YqaJ viral recombinase family protein [Schwartzia succinivorans]|nr:YqaJ viral recombinase family protein [Schwartzia succinivorans]
MSKKAIANVTNLTEEQWLDLRKRGIGGSDAAAACGFSRFKSPLTLWAEKTGRVATKPAGEAAYWGHQLEPIVRAEFSKRTGLTVEEVPIMMAMKEHPHMFADIDGIVREKDGSTSLLEIKTSAVYAGSDWSDGFPAEWYFQVQHYLAVCDLSKAYIALLLGGNQFSYKEIMRDEETISNIIALEEVFWNRVITDTPPDPDGIGSTAETLADMYPKASSVSTILDKEADDIVDYYLAVKEQCEKLKEEKTACENKLKSMLGDASCALTQKGFSVSWKNVSTNRLDTAKLKEEHPEIIDKYTSASTSRRFAVGRPKKNKNEEK